MPNIRIDLGNPVYTGQTLIFKSPADCSQVTGLKVYYPEGGSTVSKTFQFADAHGNNVGSVSLFAENVLVKIIMDTEFNRAYVQNADTNKYIEENFVKITNASSHNHPASAINSGTLSIAQGGTGKATHTSNAVLTGNGTSAVKNVATASGALYATSANGAPQFGTLPVAQGGTGKTSLTEALTAMLAAGNMVLSSSQYGDELPTAGTKGRIFFKKVT